MSLIQWICQLLGVTWQNQSTNNYNQYIITIASVILVVVISTFLSFFYRVLEGVFRK